MGVWKRGIGYKYYWKAIVSYLPENCYFFARFRDSFC